MTTASTEKFYGEDNFPISPYVVGSSPRTIWRRIVVTITNLDPSKIACTIQQYIQGSDPNVSDLLADFDGGAVSVGPPYTRLDLHLSDIVMGPHDASKVDVVEILFRLNAGKAHFHKTLAITAADTAAKDELKYLQLGKPDRHGHIREAMVCSLRIRRDAGPVAFNLGIWIPDDADSNIETLVFYDPKIENDGTIYIPPPEPPPPPPPWP